jgi:molybdate transport system regulatory protein
MNEAFDEPVVISQTGGKSGGGATLTAFGRTLVSELSAMQAEAERVLAKHVHGIEQKLKPFTGTPSPKDHDDDAAD